jgi:hypothetical protein
MTRFIVRVFPFRNRVSFKEAFEGLELGEGKPSRPVLRGPGGCKAVRLLGSNPKVRVADPEFAWFGQHYGVRTYRTRDHHLPGWRFIGTNLNCQAIVGG